MSTGTGDLCGSWLNRSHSIAPLTFLSQSHWCAKTTSGTWSFLLLLLLLVLVLDLVLVLLFYSCSYWYFYFYCSSFASLSAGFFFTRARWVWVRPRDTIGPAHHQPLERPVEYVQVSTYGHVFPCRCQLSTCTAYVTTSDVCTRGSFHWQYVVLVKVHRNLESLDICSHMMLQLTFYLFFH